MHIKSANFSTRKSERIFKMHGCSAKCTYHVITANVRSDVFLAKYEIGHSLFIAKEI